MLCGFTDHFTNFALLIGAHHGAEKANECGDRDIYVTGSVESDLLLISSCGTGMCFFVAIFICFTDACKPLSKTVYGEQGYRIRRLRWNSTQKFLQNSNLPTPLLHSPSTSKSSSKTSLHSEGSSNPNLQEILL